MELWIRSQDKSCLRKSRQAIWISYSELDNWCIECDYDTIGRYKTKERALEVLDEIHNIIKPRIITTSYECEIEKNPEDKLSFNVEMNPQKTEIIEMSTFVYEMPKD